MSARAVIANNTVTANRADGIACGAGSVVQANSVRGNTAVGIRVAGDDVIVAQNICAGNAVGIRVAVDVTNASLVTNNMLDNTITLDDAGNDTSLFGNQS